MISVLFGIFKRHEEDISKPSLVGHVPVELSKLLNRFLKADTGNYIYVEAIGKRKREVGPVVPAKFSSHTKCSRAARVLDEQLLKMKEQVSTLEFKHGKKDCIENFLFMYYREDVRNIRDVFFL